MIFKCKDISDVPCTGDVVLITKKTGNHLTFFEMHRGEKL